MKFKVDDTEVLDLNETKKKVIKNDINSDLFEEDIRRRTRFIIEHKHKQCLKRLKDEWIPRLQDKGIESIPLDDDAFAELVFAQPEYEDRKARDAKFTI